MEELLYSETDIRTKMSIDFSFPERASAIIKERGEGWGLRFFWDMDQGSWGIGPKNSRVRGEGQLHWRCLH